MITIKGKGVSLIQGHKRILYVGEHPRRMLLQCDTPNSRATMLTDYSTGVVLADLAHVRARHYTKTGKTVGDLRSAEMALDQLCDVQSAQSIINELNKLDVINK